MPKMPSQIFETERIAALGKKFYIDDLSANVSAFLDPQLMESVFAEVFQRFQPVRLVQVPRQDLESILGEVSNTDTVKTFQDTLATEIFNWGQVNLNWVARIIEANLRMPPRTYRKPYREVAASCNTCHSDVAIGRFEEKANVRFAPEQTIYHPDLLSVYPNGSLTCNNCGGNDFKYRKEADVIVIRDKIADKSEFRDRVKGVVRETASKLPRYTQTDERTLEREIVHGFFRLFSSVMTEGRPNYAKFYKMFEWVKRENFDLEQLRWMGVQKREALKHAIFDTNIVPLPIAVVRTRTKALLRLYERIVEVLYDISIKGSAKSIDDVYGARFVLPTIKHCRHLRDLISGNNISGIHKIPGTEKDNLEKARDYGYMGYHVKVSAGGYVVEVQIRTHGQDRIDETKPGLAHRVYLEEKRKIFGELPYQIRAIVATIVGVDPRYVKSLLPAV